MVVTQFLVLRRDASSAIVQVADTQVFAAQSDHGYGTETKTFCSEYCGLDNIQSGFQTTISLQTDAPAQVICT
jgi:hypothetical protein